MKYDGDVILIYGEQSYTAEVYEGENKKNIDWKNSFPNRSIIPVPCGHLDFLEEPIIHFLAELIMKQCSTKSSYEKDLAKKFKSLSRMF